MIEVRPGDPNAWASGISEEIIIQRILAGETDLYGILAVRYNSRMLRRTIDHDCQGIENNATCAGEAIPWPPRFRHDTQGK
jgi:hypothetical protein